MSRDAAWCHVAEQIGGFARHTLEASPGGTILASRSSAIYLLGAGDELLWLAPEGVPMHRRGIRVAGPLPHVSAGSTYVDTDGRLVLGSAAVVDVSRAILWEPEYDTGPHRPLEATPERRPVQALSSLVDGLPSPAGFGEFLPALTEYAHGGALPSRAWRRSPVLAAASHSVFGVARACRARDGAAILGHAAGLVGLGEGLTPSGDDFLGGVFFGLAELRRDGLRFPGCGPTALSSFLGSARRRTNRISFALLDDHAAGHSCEPAHRLAWALLGDGSPRAIRQASSELVRVGHSTGWDLLTGMWTAWALVPGVGMPSDRSGVHTIVAATP